MSLPHALEEQRRKVFIENAAAFHTTAPVSPDTFGALGIDDTLTLDGFKRASQFDIVTMTKDRITFDWIGVAAPIANALRRVLLAEVPAMAIEKVIIYQNTSIIQDEVLSHRLGLVPIAADPRQFQYVWEAGQPNELNTLVFTLDVNCTRAANVPDSATNDEKFIGSTVLSSALTWQPQGRQAKKYSGANAIKPYYDDIVLAKLRPGQSIEAELHCEKGVGAVHAKWSPVATASYRLLPEINIVQPVTGKLAEELVAKCPMNVFDIEDHHAVVARPRQCTVCRECIRGDGWSERVQLRRVRDHFIFSIETTGAYQPQDTVIEALKIIGEKARRVKREILKDKSDTAGASASTSGNSGGAGGKKIVQGSRCGRDGSVS